MDDDTPSPAPVLGIMTPSAIPGNSAAPNILLSQGSGLTNGAQILIDDVPLASSNVTFINSTSMSFNLSQAKVQMLGIGNHTVKAMNGNGTSNQLILSISPSSQNAPAITASSPLPNANYVTGAPVTFTATIHNDVSTEPLLVQILGSAISPINYLLFYQTTFYANPLGSIFTVNLPGSPTTGTFLWKITATNPTNSSLIGSSIPATLNIVQSTCSGNAPLCPLQTGVCANAQQQCVGTSFAACTATNYGSFYQSVETSCNDSLDNDCDTGSTNGGIDCQDSDCATATACLTCGNNICDPQTESCSSCSADCGVCQDVPPVNNNSGAGSGSGGGGSGGGSNGGGSAHSLPSHPSGSLPPTAISPGVQGNSNGNEIISNHGTLSTIIGEGGVSTPEALQLLPGFLAANMVMIGVVVLLSFLLVAHLMGVFI